MASTHDEAFREIQLSGKQLVFLFMAATVVSVVIFLCGVLVGRGVRTVRGLPETGDASALAAAGVEPGRAVPAAATPASAAVESKPATPPASSRSKPAKEPAPTPAKTTQPDRATPAEPAGSGFSIQVAAIRERGEADSIVTKLVGKGYPAYVVAPAKGAPGVFRVRVGKFKERAEANATAARLQKEEQFKPWVLR